MGESVLSLCAQEVEGTALTPPLPLVHLLSYLFSVGKRPGMREGGDGVPQTEMSGLTYLQTGSLPINSN